MMATLNLNLKPYLEVSLGVGLCSNTALLHDLFELASAHSDPSAT